ncbi:MAG TPA: FixH family protein [Puia sp.]|uniref:FixH family protein n=1 Tax=Puia sp. TaxID=2045100 RepID=UPI002BA95168|nr:FixH family protein [Puia sp.]HVU94148.1 FixH family protein [Puia sp.]
MNWGNKLLLVFVIFGSGISYMVYRCMQTPVDLVSKDYYKDELAYQQVIDGSRHANALSTMPRLAATEAGLRLQLPVEMKQKTLTGRIRFYCPANAARDREIPLSPDAECRQDIPKDVLSPGQYTVSISWDAGGINYFSQQSLTIR